MKKQFLHRILFCLPFFLMTCLLNAQSISSGPGMHGAAKAYEEETYNYRVTGAISPHNITWRITGGTSPQGGAGFNPIGDNVSVKWNKGVTKGKLEAYGNFGINNKYVKLEADITVSKKDQGGTDPGEGTNPPSEGSKPGGGGGTSIPVELSISSKNVTRYVGFVDIKFSIKSGWNLDKLSNITVSGDGVVVEGSITNGKRIRFYKKGNIEITMSVTADNTASNSAPKTYTIKETITVNDGTPELTNISGPSSLQIYSGASYSVTPAYSSQYVDLIWSGECGHRLGSLISVTLDRAGSYYVSCQAKDKTTGVTGKSINYSTWVVPPGEGGKLQTLPMNRFELTVPLESTSFNMLNNAKNDVIDYQVYNSMTGQLVTKGKVAKNKGIIDLDNQNKGIYVLVLFLEPDNIESHKVVVK